MFEIVFGTSIIFLNNVYAIVIGVRTGTTQMV